MSQKGDDIGSWGLGARAAMRAQAVLGSEWNNKYFYVYGGYLGKEMRLF